jgi:CheY-like chemotaxis protein
MIKILITESLHARFRNYYDALPENDVWINIARSAEEMLEIHNSERFNLLILELDSPTMGGDMLCSYLRNKYDQKDASFILVCPDNDEALERCLAGGADIVITEPVNGHEFIRKVNECIRVYPRRDLRALLSMFFHGDPESYFFTRSRNISCSGVLLETKRAMGKGDIVNFSFMLRMNKIYGRGEVVRVEEGINNTYHYGVRFINIDSKSRILIDSFIKRHSSRPVIANRNM